MNELKIAILYDSKYGNTKKLAEFMAEQLQEGGHEALLFRTKKTKPTELFIFQPEALLVGGPTHIGKSSNQELYDQTNFKIFKERLQKLESLKSEILTVIEDCEHPSDYPISFFKIRKDFIDPSH